MNWILSGSDLESHFISHTKLLGYLISDDGQVARLLGNRVTPSNVNDCCVDAEFWEFKVLFSDDKCQVWGPFLRTGGDALSLSMNVEDSLTDQQVSDGVLSSFEYRTHLIKTDKEAQDWILKYYPTLKFDSEMVVCLGSVDWEYSTL